jgi:hypothetical protein
MPDIEMCLDELQGASKIIGMLILKINPLFF